MTDYSRAYSDSALRAKLKAIAGLKHVIEAAEQVHALMRDPQTPFWMKGLCVAALGYLILPTDAVADFIPVLGHGDDLLVLATAIGAMAARLREERARAVNAD
jgi:uncharacterized membrane protein YkvA (DUF1232 family)